MTPGVCEEAVQRGAGDGWLDVLPISPCPAPLDQNVVVDVSPLVPRNWLRNNGKIWLNNGFKKKNEGNLAWQCWIKFMVKKMRKSGNVDG